MQHGFACMNEAWVWFDSILNTMDLMACQLKWTRSKIKKLKKLRKKNGIPSGIVAL